MDNKIIYITYATGEKYLEKAKNVLPTMKEYFHETILYKKEDIHEKFYDKNKKIFNNERGAGYWLWKPYFILKTLEGVEENDIVFYLDLGDALHYDIKDFIKEKIQINDGFLLVKNFHSHLQWTKNDCFKLMDCNENKYLNSTQLEAGCCAFSKNDTTLKFVKEWLEFCQNYDVISSESKSPNVPYFKEHRYDQSILTNLAIKYDIKTVSIYDVSKYVSYNEFF